MTRVSTILARDLELQKCTEKMDSMCKKILSNKIILAWIMKSVVKEYAGCGVAEIASELIEGTPKISEVLLHRDEVYVDERIVGGNTEDITVTEGKATFDIYFTAIVPNDFNNNSEWTKHYMNVEPQDEFYIGYPIIKRGRGAEFIKATMRGEMIGFFTIREIKDGIYTSVLAGTFVKWRIGDLSTNVQTPEGVKKLCGKKFF